MYRALHADEIATLVKNDNSAENWAEIFVTDAFNPNLIVNCEFYGLVRIGDLDPRFIEHHDLRLPVGISNSTIISCDIGDNVAIHDVRYLAHYIIGDNCILLNVDEMHTTNHAKFGNGIVKDGEPEDVRIWLDLCNETGGRTILPFDGMMPADAYLWAKYRDDPGSSPGSARSPRAGSARGAASTARSASGRSSRTAGSSRTSRSARMLHQGRQQAQEPHDQLHGRGADADRRGRRAGQRHRRLRLPHLLRLQGRPLRHGQQLQLKYGARLIHSFLGDNSTVSCCELLNNLIFPVHEQHHNNSFLIASMVMGQSNIAAGATIGSNHNTRANDGEIVAGRGFWPGLCTSFKHNCRFASFVLVAKGDYSDELDIRYPFSMIFAGPAGRRGPRHARRTGSSTTCTRWPATPGSSRSATPAR